MKKIKAHIKPFAAILYCSFSDTENDRFTEGKLYSVIDGRLFTDKGNASCMRFRDLKDINEKLKGKARFWKVVSE